MKNLILSFILFLFFIVSGNTGVIVGKNKNLVLSADITASSFAGKDFLPSNAIDNNLNTTWKAKKSVDPQWLMVDLKGDYALSQVCQTFAESGVWKFKIEGSVDKENWMVLVDKSKGISGITFAESINGIYRYLKLTIYDSGNKLIPSSKELIIYGIERGRNLALGKHCTHNLGYVHYEPNKAVDGDMSTYWLATGSFPQSIILDLRKPCTITSVQQVFKEYDNWKFTIEGSPNHQEWDMLLDKTGGDTGFSFKADVDRQDQYQFIRLTVLGSSSGFTANSCEFNAYGFESEDEKNDLKNIPSRNLAFHVSASVSSFERNDYDQYKALDGNGYTFWRAEDDSMPQWICADLGNVCEINEISQHFINDDIWSFRLEGSNDNENWDLLVDKSSGFEGQYFSGKVEGKYRYIRSTILDAKNGNRAGVKELAVFGNGSPKQSRWWEDTSGMTRYYPKYYGQSLNSITDSLDIIQSQGFQILELSSIYEGDPEVWGGLGATNNYAIDPSIGNLADFERLVDEVHKRDMKIIFFGNIGYCWHQAPFFIKACEDHRNDVYSKERYWFNFNKEKLSDRWFWSDLAQAYYYSFWGNTDGANGRIPNYNFNNKEWREEACNYLDFWAGKGVDGLLLDAPGAYDGINDAIIEENIANVLNKYGIITNAEGSWEILHWIGKFGFNSIQGFDIYGWGGGKKSDVLAAMRAKSPAGLNDKLKNYRDVATSVHGVTITPPMWEIPASYEERIFEVAYLSTLGTILVNHYGDHHREYIAQFILSQWPKQEQERFYNLIRTQTSYKGLAPYGQRICLPTNDDTKYTAFKRTNKDGNVSALVVFNFQDAEQNISVNLNNTGISTDQVPIDLLKGSAGKPITSGLYEITLPAYGYVILGVKND